MFKDFNGILTLVYFIYHGNQYLFMEISFRYTYIISIQV